MKDWEYHPLALLVPPMTPDELAGLEESILKNGVRLPGMEFEGKLLDGRNRDCIVKAIRARGITKAENGSDIELIVKNSPNGWTTKQAALYVVDANLKRRNLTKEQVRATVVKLHDTFSEAAKERQRAAGGDKKSDAAKANAELAEASADRLAPNDAERSGKASRLTAKATGLSERQVERIVAVDKKGTPEVKAAVESGSVSVSKGAKIAALPKFEQNAKLAEATGAEVPATEPPADPIRAVIDEARSQVASLLLKLTAIDKQLDACERLPGFDAIPMAVTLKMNTGAIREALTEQRPYGVCPSCRGEKCNACKNRGWVTIGSWNGFSEEKRAKVYSAK